MTYRELKEEVIDLGFDSRIDDPRVLVSATNRAVRHIRRFYPARERSVFLQTAPVCHHPAATPVPTALRFEGREVAAFSFSYVGEGSMTLRFGEETRTEALAAPGWRDKKVILPARLDLQVTFNGKAHLTVRHFAMLPLTDSTDCEALLPVCEERTVCYDLKEANPRFLALGGVPQRSDGTGIHNYTLTGSLLRLPAEHCGTVTVSVIRLPCTATLECFTGALQDTEPDCPAELVDLLPLLVASYLWLDLEPEKAQYYKSCFDEQYRMWRLQQSFKGDGTVTSRKGWH
ncbi:MAG: hypothetical protein E7590_00985 [Ruminococcaceae bacterium]|nr:hypothetical protein [Oscillospiraceae bacterium]